MITPTQQGKECLIKHMLAVDWKFWKSYLKKASSRSITIRMLGRVAGRIHFSYTHAFVFLPRVILNR